MADDDRSILARLEPTLARKRGWLRSALALVQVRLRIPLAILAAATVIGRWDVIENYWEGLGRELRLENESDRPVSSETEYFCPMDPGVVSDWPGKCGVCNMALVRRKRGEAAALPDGVVARMQVSPTRIELADIRTTPVAYRPLERRITLEGEIVRQSGALVAVGRAPIRHAGWITVGLKASVFRLAEPGREPIAATVRSIERVTAARITRLEITIGWEQAAFGLHEHDPVLIELAAPLCRELPFARLPGADRGQVLAVPRSAVVDLTSDGRGVVFVESAPGMFDGVQVVLGPRCGDDYPVVSGLSEGDRVVAAGAFLLDAETRLNPGLASAYFGARGNDGAAKPGAPPRALSTNRPAAPAPTPVRTTKNLARLAPADQALARRQARCPVTLQPLGSMGTPVRIEIQGRVVFLCCDGCTKTITADPQKYLSRLTSTQTP